MMDRSGFETERKFDFEKENLLRLISTLESENIALKLAVEEKDEKIVEMDKWVNVLSDLHTSPDSEHVVDTINKSIVTVEKLRLEKFYLKKELAYERKRYNDLKNAFIELRKETKDKEIDYNETDKLQLVEDKISLQNTVCTLTDEIESLSVKNEEFLQRLKINDFYYEYEKVWEELKNLKDAHALLINMIKDDEIQINATNYNGSSRLGESQDLIKDTSFMIGTDLSKMSGYKQIDRQSPLQEIDTNQGRNTGLSALLSWNGFNGIMKNGKLREGEIDLTTSRNIESKPKINLAKIASVQNNVEFLSNRLGNVDVNFLKRNSP